MARGEALENMHFGAFLCFLAVLPGDPFVWFIGLRMLKDVSWGQQRLAKVKRQILVYRTALYSDVQTNSSSTYSLVAWYLNCTLSYWAFCHYELWVCTLKFCERFAIVSGISSDLVGIWWDYPIHESQLVSTKLQPRIWFVCRRGGFSPCLMWLSIRISHWYEDGGSLQKHGWFFTFSRSEFDFELTRALLVLWNLNVLWLEVAAEAFLSSRADCAVIMISKWSNKMDAIWTSRLYSQIPVDLSILDL